MTKNLVVRIEKLADDACWPSGYYWGANASVHFLVWRYPQRDSYPATAQIKKFSETVFVWAVSRSGHAELSGSWEYTLEAAKRACQRLINAHIQQVFREEYVPPLG
jgi:hypothetical protein